MLIEKILHDADENRRRHCDSRSRWASPATEQKAAGKRQVVSKQKAPRPFADEAQHWPKQR